MNTIVLPPPELAPSHVTAMQRKPCTACGVRLAPLRYTRCTLCRTVQATKNTSENMAIPQKRKVSNLEEEEAEDSALVLLRLRKRYKLMVLPPPPTITPTKTHRTKYADAPAIFRAVAQAQTNPTTAPLNFSGTFAIVATPDVDHESRVRLVSRELRRATSVQFDTDEGIVIPSSGSTRKFTLCFKCNCHNGRPLVRTKSKDLFAYFTSSKKKGNSTASQETQSSPPTQPTGPPCEGITIISAEDDTSHPRFMGQRIKLAIKHPKA
ncbi:hypothetical protein MIND_00130400 [Mycena indigotica]|uniref:Uncharacterized protein n=1 Tax=Mycena indigotica TaxID=2126181 RepID=A0A8H6TCM9_9AGAR|nr:uncharacterized protein MIND_00130400 [Mycena indigotica]KAF7316123.1 hypothetical protein MIND_00130400 [Mycena indigotica]